MKVRTGLLLGGALILALGSALMGTGQEAQAASKNATLSAPGLTCSIKVPSPEPADLSALAKIKAGDAMAAAKKAFPDIAVKKVELDNENGCLVYSLELRNGGEVLVDAGNGSILRQESPAAEHSKHEADEEAD
ncbi:MAG: PepSY domain-containing protein [Syntrophobacterales bacterium]|nr:PepSY domain-containing protein [Syntrophobacterales bacterium]